MKQTCTSHCTACNKHFHGDKAFDLHRRNFKCLEPEIAISERDNQLLVKWTEDGLCKMSNLPETEQNNVAIWRSAREATRDEQRQQRLIAVEGTAERTSRL